MENMEASMERKLKVLIVDDDTDLGTFMRMKLSMEAPGFSIAFVESGHECLEFLKSNPVDCIISDYQMPGMDGMELLLALRENGNDTPFIFVTGQGNEEVAREAFKNGAYDYFTKEFGFAHFARIINSVGQAVSQRNAEMDRKRAEEAQRLSDENVSKTVSLLRAALESTPDGILIVDNGGHVSCCNDKFLKMWMIPRPISESMDDKALLECVLDQLKEPQQFLDKVHDIYADPDAEVLDVLEFKDGRLFERYSQPQKLGEETVGRVWSFRDITDRKRVEDALKASQKYLQTIIETEPECVKLLASDGTLIMMNRAGLAMIEADSLEQVKGALVVDLVAPEYRDAFTALGETVFSGGAGTLEFDMVGLNGRYLRLETHAVPLRNEKDDIIALLGITRDISERKNLERNRKDFHAMVTHDLKSPLTAILGYAELIAKAAKGGECETIVEMSKAVARSGQNLLRLVGDFMTVEKLEFDGIELRTMAEDVAGLLLEVHKDFEAGASKAGITFRADIPDSLPRAFLDKKHFERAVGNLLQNAFNYTPKGGEVTLTAEAASEGQDGYLLVSVSDNGPGISNEEKVKMFDKYYRSQKTAGTKGTGLGLAIVKAVAEAHGGRVDVESEEGKGSTFRLYLPISS